ncbi:hypothetical protein SMC26_24045 [Actinomadura fulvescens]|uniref:Uncharacterized protein n=1 Tax=Actinomadura fulvescens TaxID=46160 RepID=A0ABN3Q369_9ACTN
MSASEQPPPDGEPIPMGDAVRYARRWSEAVGDLNHSTAPWNAWPGLANPQTVGQVLSILSAGSLGLQRSLKQLRSYLAHGLRERQIDCDDGHPQQAVTAAAIALFKAEGAVTDLVAALERARTATSGLRPADPQRHDRP